MPERPESVPADATWVEADLEWQHGERDGANRLQGLVRWWRPDGTLCCEAEYSEGRPHGRFTRFHPNGEHSQRGTFLDGKVHGLREYLRCTVASPERSVDGFAPVVWRVEEDFENGQPIRVGRVYDRAGVRIWSLGTPYPVPPEGVPAHAHFEGGGWMDWRLDAARAKTGPFSAWTGEGVLVEAGTWSGGRRHGPGRLFHSDGSVAGEGVWADGSRAGTWCWTQGPPEAAEVRDAPRCSRRVSRAETDYGPGGQLLAVRFFTAGGACDADGTRLGRERAPIARLREAIRAVDWAALETAGGAGHAAVQLALEGALARTRRVRDAAQGQLWWHLCHQGSIYPASATALPLLVRMSRTSAVEDRASIAALVHGMTTACPSAALDGRWGNEPVLVHAALLGAVDDLLGGLDGDDPRLRAWHATLLATAREREGDTVPALRARLAVEVDPVVRGALIHALASLGHPAAAAGPPRDALLDLVAATSCPAPGTVEIEVLLAALTDPAPLEAGWGALCHTDDGVAAAASAALVRAGAGADGLEGMLAAFPSAGAPASLSLGETLLHVAFGPPGEEEPARRRTAPQKRVLAALAASDAFFRFDVNARELLGAWSLPLSREELRAAGAGRPKPRTRAKAPKQRTPV